MGYRRFRRPLTLVARRPSLVTGESRNSVMLASANSQLTVSGRRLCLLICIYSTLLTYLPDRLEDCLEDCLEVAGEAAEKYVYM